ncbi:MAG: bifunctional chorismate mutase/prephenate dehydratase [Eubacteriales bacterium]|nr:bifunctional chorismate mutase/prephenate dehydratase [Eubacteriales bacterium]
MDKMKKDVNQVREDIREVDYQIAELFEKRMKYAAELAQAKKEVGAPIYDKNREDEKLADITKNRSNPFIVKGLEEVFIQMMSISRKYQYHLVHQRDRYIENYFTEVPELERFPDTRVVYAGVPGSFTGMACEKFFGKDVDHYGVAKFKEVALALNDGDADYGVLPIENSSAGDVTGVYNILLENDVCIVGEVFVKVDHCLLGCPGSKIEEIHTVYSHPQGLMQCAPYLEKMGAEQISVENTAIAAEMIARKGDKKEAAIASRRAAELYGLDILEESINFDDANVTRFVILSKKRQYTETAGKISISFSLVHESGTLYNILSHFLYNDLNLSHIESVPLPDKQWEYRFYIDITGNLHDPAVRNALQGVRTEVADFKILGNY